MLLHTFAVNNHPLASEAEDTLYYIYSAINVIELVAVGLKQKLNIAHMQGIQVEV